jgi:hypothetical protein
MRPPFHGRGWPEARRGFATPRKMGRGTDDLPFGGLFTSLLFVKFFSWRVYAALLY